MMLRIPCIVSLKTSYLIEYRRMPSTIYYAVTTRHQIQSTAVPAGGVCSQQKLDAARACAGRHTHDVLANQHLFDVYVHAHPMIHSYERSSLFFGQLVANRVTVRSGKTSALAAHRKL